MMALKKMKRFSNKLMTKVHANPDFPITLEVIEACLAEAQTSMVELGGVDEIRKILNIHPSFSTLISF